MFLRRTERRKNGKAHLYWSIVENKRLDCGRVVQRHVLYSGEINSSQAEAWRKAVEVFDADAGGCQTLALFADDRCEAVAADASVVRLRLAELRPASSAPMGWRDSCGGTSTSIGSGPIACLRAGRERAGTAFSKSWSPID